MSSSIEYANLGKWVVWKFKNKTEDFGEERIKKGKNKWGKSIYSLGIASIVHTRIHCDPRAQAFLILSAAVFKIQTLFT